MAQLHLSTEHSELEFPSKESEIINELTTTYKNNSFSCEDKKYRKSVWSKYN